MHLDRQRFNALGERLDGFRESRVLLHHFYKERHLPCCKGLSLFGRVVQIFTMRRIRYGCASKMSGAA